MKEMRRFSPSAASVIAALLFLNSSPRAHSQISVGDKAQALLEQVKAQEIERQQSAKAKEIARLNEDLEKDKKEADDLKQSAVSMNAAVTDANNHLAQITARKKQLGKMIEVLSLQIDAETMKVDGLKMLGDAQMKGAGALSRRMEEKQVRGEIEKARLNPLPGQTDSRSELETERRLDRAERATSTARSEAREAMTAATNKLAAAKAADEKTKSRAAELGIPIQEAPSATQENIEPLKDIDPLQTDANIPIALPVKK